MMTQKQPKIPVVHCDLFGKEITTGMAVVYTRGNSLMIGTVGKMTNVMIRVHSLSGWGKRDGTLHYPSQTVIVDGPNVTMYVLKHSS